EDLGTALRYGAKILNSSAPSSLGTILSFGLMGMAKALHGKASAEPIEVAQALVAGVENIMAKAESAPGEKTILDSLHPGALALASGLGEEERPVEDAVGEARSEERRVGKGRRRRRGRGEEGDESGSGRGGTVW